MVSFTHSNHILDKTGRFQLTEDESVLVFDVKQFTSIAHRWTVGGDDWRWNEMLKDWNENDKNPREASEMWEKEMRECRGELTGSLYYWRLSGPAKLLHGVHAELRHKRVDRYVSPRTTQRSASRTLRSARIRSITNTKLGSVCCARGSSADEHLKKMYTVESGFNTLYIIYITYMFYYN